MAAVQSFAVAAANIPSCRELHRPNAFQDHNILKTVSAIGASLQIRPRVRLNAPTRRCLVHAEEQRHQQRGAKRCTCDVLV